MHVELTWHVKRDGHKICPICEDLDGHTWVFTVGKDEFPQSLFHPMHGLVWTMGEGSAVHGVHGMRGDCRCSVTPHLHLQDLLARITLLANRIEAAVVQGQNEEAAVQ